MADMAMVLVLLSYRQWGPFGEALFGFPLVGRPWVAGFAAVAIWASA